LIDRSSIEVFGNDGQVVFTDQIFPTLQSDGLNLYSIDGDAKLNTLEVNQLNRAYIK
jgi:fructan beta-fructosidase